MNQWEDDENIKIFQKYLKIPTVHPDVDYEPCVEFLREQANVLDLAMKVYYPGGPEKPIVIMSWIGTEPNLQTILLNSHMDVVPVFEENWTHLPFSAFIDSEGRIFARGAQDMKCVGMQYLAAIKVLKSKGIKCSRTIHISFVPDEEIGGKLGMCKFVSTDDFKTLNVGFALDEGIASPTEEFLVFFAERSIWHAKFRICGTPGHGSLLHKNTAGEKLQHIINKLMDFRKHEVEKLKNNQSLTIGDVTTINLTVINGGVQNNVVPPLIDVSFDIRLSLNINQAEFEKMLNDLCEEAGGDITIEYDQKEPFVEPTKLNESNIYWKAFENVMHDCGLKTKICVFPGGTDSRYIRKVGIPAIGFSPMNNTPVLLHDHDEFIKAETYLTGIKIYEKLIAKISHL